jgi:putative transposase
MPNLHRHYQQHPKRHPTHYNTPGHAHALTFSCYKQRDYLRDQNACELLLLELQSVRAEHRLQVWAYVFMPNHVHLLIWPTESEYSISRIQNDIKGRMAKRYRDYVLLNEPARFRSFLLRERGREVFRFWQHGGGFDRNLWNATAIRRSIEYIEENPVRKGLASSPEEYRWSSAYARESGTGLVPDRFRVPVAMLDPQRQRIGLV